ncbi:hypothetical protein [Erwinia sp. 9145]|uniref:hypothetical protein n=1 Tax=Erwinia sp. 9145 TaxID=1500895 RepID=UPI00054F28C9|nr:hypothetical protein [Erwinia sp. 9145]
MALDHGMLNVPLDKRGNFHKELDDHLTAEKRRKDDELFVRKTIFNNAKAEAKLLYDLMDNGLIKAEAKRRGMKLSEFRDVLQDIRDFKPKHAHIVFNKFIKAAN